MIRRRRREPAADPDAPSPWARGDTEFSSEPADFDWSAVSAPTPRDQPDDATDDGADGRRRAVVASAVVAAVAIAGAVVLWPRDEGDEGAGDPTADEAPPTFASLPTDDENQDDDPAFDDGETDGPDDPATTDDPSDTGDATGGDGDGLATALDPLVDDEDDRPTRLELPVGLAATSLPTEIVLATREGIATLSLPSGRLDYSVTEIDSVGGNIVVAPEAAAYATPGSSGSSSITIVPRVGRAIEVDDLGDGFVRGWVTTGDGRTAFQVQSFGPEGDRTFLVDTAGAVVEVDSALSANGFSTYDYARTAELSIVNDAGGVYRLAPDGTATRIAPGRAFAANGDHLLVRECDESLSCSLFVRNWVTGDAVEVDATLDIPNVFGLDLSPDGTAVVALPSSGNRSDVLRLIELGSGASVDVGTPGPVYFTPGSLWLADSSGTVQPPADGVGLSFLDRATGERTEFGEELGRVYSLGMRYPDAELPPSTGPLVETDVGLSGELATPTGLDVAVLGTLGTMVRLDIDTGEAVAWSVPVPEGNDPVELVHLRDTVTALTDDDGFVTEVGRATPIDPDVVSIPGAPRFPGPGQGLVWAPVDDDDPEAVDHRLQTVDPALPASDGARITVPSARLIGGDGSGGLVVSAPGGAFALTASDTTRLTAGDLLAIGSGHVLARECDAALQCRTLMFDRSTGARSADVPPRRVGEAVRGDTIAMSGAEEGPQGATLSPDGTVAVTRVDDPDAASGWALNDLATGNWEEIPAPVDRQPLVWSDDGSTLVYLSEAGLVVWQREAGGRLRVEGLGDAAAIVRVTDEFAPAAD